LLKFGHRPNGPLERDETPMPPPKSPPSRFRRRRWDRAAGPRRRRTGRPGHSRRRRAATGWRAKLHHVLCNYAGFLALAALVASGTAFSLAERGSPAGDQLRGTARVIDGDTLAIRGQRIRLHGIDAPETGQTCRDGAQRWPCGRRSTQALYERVAGHNVRCLGDRTDRYGRRIAVCHADRANLNAWMVEQGWALAYRRYARDFVAQERVARGARAGIWQGDFVAPWKWRRGARLQPGG
jgi:endonuclease YncB( thermonuclease family)